MPTLQVQNISKSFQDKLVISDCSLEAKSGDRIIITGDNGIGKSTLLKIIGGHLLADSGELMINSKNSRSISFNDFKASVTLVSSSENVLYPRISGIENILYFSKLLSLESTFLQNRIKTWSENKLFLSSLNTSFYDCSQGMKRILSLFILTLSSPKIILLDECFKSFDINNRREVLDLLDKEFSDSIIVLCTHHSEEFSEFKKLKLNGALVAN